jgi:hypothetical protein
MEAQHRRGTIWIVSGLLICALLTVTYFLSIRRQLTDDEQKLIGAWCFSRPEDSNILHVYHFDPHGRAIEEHYYLTSATPTVPRLRMYGVWRLERDNRMVVERPGGIDGLIGEAARQVRVFRGDRQSDIPLLTRFYRLVGADASGLRFHTSRAAGSGKYEETELLMAPFTSVPGIKP